MQFTSFSSPKTGGTNEDAVRCEWHPEGDSALLVALADGQGGRAGGAEAAQTAVATAIAQASAVGGRKLLKERFWRQLVFDVDTAVAQSPEAGFTTFVGLAVSDSRVVGASSGDSQAVLIAEDGASLRLTASQKKNPPVGSGFCDPVPFSAPLADGAKLVVMSDGVYKFTAWGTICSTVSQLPGDEAAAALQTTVAGKDGTLYDDFSLVIVESGAA